MNRVLAHLLPIQPGPGMIVLGPLVMPLTEAETDAVHGFRALCLDCGHELVQCHDRVVGVVTLVARAPATRGASR